MTAKIKNQRNPGVCAAGVFVFLKLCTVWVHVGSNFVLSGFAFGSNAHGSNRRGSGATTN